MAYRNDVDALAARHHALEAELAERTRERDDVARMLAEAKARDAEEKARLHAETTGPARRRRRRAVLVATLSAIAMIGAVGYRASHRRTDRFDRAIERFRLFTDDMCHCAEPTCARHVSDRVTAWASEEARHVELPRKLDKAAEKRMTVIVERYSHCLMKAMAMPQAAESAESAEAAALTR